MSSSGEPSAKSSFEEIRQQIDKGFTSFRQGLIVSLCFLLYVADGYDVLSISMAAPHIAADWNISPQVLGFVLSAELIGMMVGSIILSSVSDRYGRRHILLSSVALISTSMVLTAWCTSIAQLMILRLLTGFGIGGVIGAGAAMASEYSPEKRRNQAIISLTCGFSLGAIVVGPIANTLLEASGWQSIFMLGGIAGFVILALMVVAMPESLEFIARKQPKDEQEAKDILQQINGIMRQLSLQPLSQFIATKENTDEAESEVGKPKVGFGGLLSAEFRTHTLRLWGIFFLLYWVIYLIIKWTPKLFNDMGYSITNAIYALTISTIGGLIGNISVGAAITRFKVERLVVAALFIGGAIFAAFALLKPTSINTLYVILFCVQFFISGAFSGMYAIATNSYPTHLRASGLGYSVGIGRFGAVLSPIATGFLVAAEWNMFTIYLLFAVPFVLLSGVLVQLSIRGR